MNARNAAKAFAISVAAVIGLVGFFGLMILTNGIILLAFPLALVFIPVYDHLERKRRRAEAEEMVKKMRANSEEWRRERYEKVKAQSERLRGMAK